MRFSTFGQRFSERNGTRDLMNDLGAVARDPSRWINLGGGNPSAIPMMTSHLAGAIDAIQTRDGWLSILTAYDNPQGYQPFLAALAPYLSENLGWDLSVNNILITPGSQASFFMLFNLFAGSLSGGLKRSILLPQSPEYIGYTQSAFEPNLLQSSPSLIDLIGETRFKYRVDFEALSSASDFAAICVSRPTNPSGNVLSDAEVLLLSQLAIERGVPLIIDSAYGRPFPGIVFSPTSMPPQRSSILCLSLSKLGLPGARTGIVVAEPAIIDALTSMSAMLNLAPNPIGARLGLEIIKKSDLTKLSEAIIAPHYLERSRNAVAICDELLRGLPYRIHMSEGAIFLWLWFPGLPISSQELYMRLKSKGVLIIPGTHFGPGLSQAWPHLAECIRVSYAQPEAVLAKGIKALADELTQLYG